MEIDEQMDVEIRLATIVNYDGVRVEFSGENKFHVELMPEIFQVADPIITSEWYESVLSDPDQMLFAAVIGKDVLGVALVEVKKNLDDTIFTHAGISIWRDRRSRSASEPVDWTFFDGVSFPS